MNDIFKNQRYNRLFLCTILIIVIGTVSGCQHTPSVTDNEDTQKQTVVYNETESDTTPETVFVSDSKGDSEETEQNTYVDDATEILHRFQTVDWETIQPRTLADDDWSTNIIRLAAITEPQITMYGYNDENYSGRGVAIDMGGSMHYFDWIYMTPRIVMPRIYWKESEHQLQVSLYNYSGTGVGAEELHILQQTDQNELKDYCLTVSDYASMLADRVDFSYEIETNTLTLYDKSDNQVLDTIVFTWLNDAGLEKIELKGIALGDIACFKLGEDIGLRITPGYFINDWATPQYRDMHQLQAELRFEEIDGQKQFSLGTIQRCLSDGELCALAEKYYAAHSESGFVPSIIEVDGETEDGQVLIHLYEDMEDHTATYDWYTVNRITGKGTNVLLEEINLLEE